MMNYGNQRNIIYDSSQQEINRIILQFRAESKQNQRALCCLLGTYAGDNLGNYKEIWKSITDEQISEIMKMNGSGTQNLLGGQSTDDCELATSLGFGLIETQQSGLMNLDIIAKYYSIWYNSQPFEFSNTVWQALKPLKGEQIKIESSYSDYIYKSLALKVKASAYQHNQNSKSSASLARIAPLIVYLCQQNDEQIIKKAVYEEQSLTHCNEEVLECSYIFVRSCIQLIQCKSAQEVFKSANLYVQGECKIKEIQDYWQNHVLQEKYTNSTINEGHIMHPFTQAFIILKQLSQTEKYSGIIKRKNIYQYFISKIIQDCGCTSSNLAICGTLIGCYLELKEFPEDYLQIIIKCDLQDKSQNLLKLPRMPIYNPRNCIYLCTKLLEYGLRSEQKIQIYPIGTEDNKKSYQLEPISINNYNQIISQQSPKNQVYYYPYSQQQYQSNMNNNNDNNNNNNNKIELKQLKWKNQEYQQPNNTILSNNNQSQFQNKNVNNIQKQNNVNLDQIMEESSVQSLYYNENYQFSESINPYRVNPTAQFGFLDKNNDPNQNQEQYTFSNNSLYQLKQNSYQQQITLPPQTIEQNISNNNNINKQANRRRSVSPIDSSFQYNFAMNQANFPQSQKTQYNQQEYIKTNEKQKQNQAVVSNAYYSANQQQSIPSQKVLEKPKHLRQNEMLKPCKSQCQFQFFCKTEESPKSTNQNVSPKYKQKFLKLEIESNDQPQQNLTNTKKQLSSFLSNYKFNFVQSNK